MTRRTEHRSWREDQLVQIQLSRLRLNANSAVPREEPSEDLMASIAKYGLQRNLIVRGAGWDGCHEILSGERRLRALDALCTLRGTPDYPVPCFVVTESTREKLVLQSYDAPFWELGCVFVNYRAAGFTLREIAARIGKSQAYVSTAATLARTLAPAVIARLNETAGAGMSMYRLSQIAALQSPVGPDEPAQIKLFERMRANPRGRGRPRTPRTDAESILRRFQLLKRGQSSLRVDPVFEPFLQQVIRYLGGASTAPGERAP